MMARSSAGVSEFQVVIVGGGLVGLSLAAALGGGGLQVAVIDRQAPEELTADSYDGRSSAIAYGSQQALNAIGAWPAMSDRAEPILDIRVSDGASSLFLHYDHRQVCDHPLGYIVENQAIRNALFDRIAALENVSQMAPAQVAAITYGTQECKIRLGDGRVLRSSVVIAADGRNSRLRSEAGIRVARWTYAQTGIVCTVEHEYPHRGIAHERFLPAGPLAFLPMTDDTKGRHRSSIVWTERSATAPTMMSLGDDAFCAELSRRFGPSLGELHLAGRRWAYPLSLLLADRYVGPRLALVGDAAHAMHPIAGQGFNLGLRDMAALAQALVDGHRLGLDIGSSDILSGYQRRRRFDGLVLMAATDGLNRLFSNDIAPVRLAREIGLAAVNELPQLKKFFMRHAMGLVGDLPRLLEGRPL